MEELGLKVTRTNGMAVTDDELREIIPEDVLCAAVGILKENPDAKDVRWLKKGSNLQIALG